MDSPSLGRPPSSPGGSPPPATARELSLTAGSSASTEPSRAIPEGMVETFLPSPQNAGEHAAQASPASNPLSAFKIRAVAGDNPCLVELSHCARKISGLCDEGCKNSALRELQALFSNDEIYKQIRIFSLFNVFEALFCKVPEEWFRELPQPQRNRSFYFRELILCCKGIKTLIDTVEAIMSGNISTGGKLFEGQSAISSMRTILDLQASSKKLLSELQRIHLRYQEDVEKIPARVSDFVAAIFIDMLTVFSGVALDFYEQAQADGVFGFGKGRRQRRFAHFADRQRVSAAMDSLSESLDILLRMKAVVSKARSKSLWRFLNQTRSYFISLRHVSTIDPALSRFGDQVARLYECIDFSDLPVADQADGCRIMAKIMMFRSRVRESLQYFERGFLLTRDMTSDSAMVMLYLCIDLRTGRCQNPMRAFELITRMQSDKETDTAPMKTVMERVKQAEQGKKNEQKLTLGMKITVSSLCLFNPCSPEDLGCCMAYIEQGMKENLPDAFLFQGVYLAFVVKDADQALRFCDQHPLTPLVWLKAYLLEQKGLREEAGETYLHLAMNYSHHDALVPYALMCIEKGDLFKAQQAYLLAGRYYQRNNRPDDAEECFNCLEQLRGELPDEQQLRNQKQAEQLLERIRPVSPSATTRTRRRRKKRTAGAQDAVATKPTRQAETQNHPHSGADEQYEPLVSTCTPGIKMVAEPAALTDETDDLTGFQLQEIRTLFHKCNSGIRDREFLAVYQRLSEILEGACGKQAALIRQNMAWCQLQMARDPLYLAEHFSVSDLAMLEAKQAELADSAIEHAAKALSELLGVGSERVLAQPCKCIEDTEVKDGQRSVAGSLFSVIGHVYGDLYPFIYTRRSLSQQRRLFYDAADLVNPFRVIIREQRKEQAAHGAGRRDKSYGRRQH